MGTRHLVLLLLLGAIAAQCVYYYPLLPVHVASHFGAGGQPNGWTTRDGFFALYFIILAVMTFAMFVLPPLLRYFRTTAINVPNREYWLLPEHREQAYSMLENEMAWFGNAILAFLACVMQLVFEANVAAPPICCDFPPGPGLDEQRFLILLAIFFAFVIFWLVRFYRRFAVPA